MAGFQWSRWHTDACEGLVVLMFLGALGGWVYGAITDRRRQ